VAVGNNLTVAGTATVGGVAAVAVAPGTSGNVLTSNGTAWTSAASTGGAINVQTFTSSGTWTKPAGYAAGSRVFIQAWGGGGSGAKASVAGGGGGGGYNERWITLSALGATETVTIGAGGTAVTTSTTNGNTGGTTTFGSWVSAYGGGAGTSGGAGGGGGGQLSAGAPSVSGAPWGGIQGDSNSLYSGGWIVGGSGGSPGAPGSPSVWGGGGGGGLNFAGGASSFGGAGGAGLTASSGTAGSQPGGGGGGTSTGTASGAGGAGQVIITVFPA
jgi:hypothetical protein